MMCNTVELQIDDIETEEDDLAFLDSIGEVDNVKCEECGRVFDLFDEDQAEEYHYGHDCEIGE